MTALDLFRRRPAAEVVPAGPRMASLESPAQPLTSATLLEWFGGKPTASGVEVTEHGAMALPAVWRAVTLISGTIAALPLDAYRYPAPDTRQKQTDTAAARLLADPHPDLTAFELWELGMGSLCLWGNAYFLKLRNQLGEVVELWWIAPSRVKTGRASDGSKVYVFDGDIEHPRGDDTVLHIPGFGYDGTVGLSPIRVARQSLGTSLAAEQYGGSLFGSAGLATGILTTDMRLEQDQADALRARWKEQGTGLASAHDIRVLGSGARFQQLTIPPEDAQFIQTRQYGNSDVARLFGLPPHMLAEVEKSTSWGTGIEQQVTGMVVFTFRTWLERVEQRLTKMWRRDQLPDRAKYNLNGLLRGDSAQRAEFYNRMWNLGAFSTNEIRALEDMPPVEGGDVRYRPLNMGRLGTSEDTDPAVPPAPEED